MAINTLRCLLNATRQLLAVRGVRTVVLATSASTAHMPVLLSWPNRTKAEEFARQLDLLNFGIRAVSEAWWCLPSGTDESLRTAPHMHAEALCWAMA